MKLGPRYKIARRLGAPVFEKTQTQKYALSLARKEKNFRKGRRRSRSEFGAQLIEKQKARLTYYLSEKQFSKYVSTAMSTSTPAQKLFELLESRLDNVIYRSGLAQTRRHARQVASHGHVLVNNRRVTIPSISLKEGDVISIREGSKESPLFADVSERMKTMQVPAWLEVDPNERKVTVKGKAVYEPSENMFNLAVVFEFYSR